MLSLAKGNNVTSEKIYLKNLPEQFRGQSIFFISDIHNRLISDKIINRVKDKAELVIIGGDLMEKNVPLEKVRINVKKLTEIGKVLFVWGNNDGENLDEEFSSVLQNEGVFLLENDFYKWNISGESLYIAGLDDWSRGRAKTSFLTNLPGPLILVMHDPAMTARLPSGHCIQCAFTGHTHGGQIRLGPLGLREKGGWKNRNGIPVLVSSGYGTTCLPLRLGAPSETHLISLYEKV
ncbi:metallophosphoesterase [Alteribacillus sp. HJP-4]